AIPSDCNTLQELPCRQSVPSSLPGAPLSRDAGRGFGIEAGGIGAQSAAGPTAPRGPGAGAGGGATVWDAAPICAPPPRPPGRAVGACAPVRSSGGSRGASGLALRHVPPGRPATGTPSCAARMNRLQISTGRLPPDTFLVGELSSLPSQTPATR